ncbi:MAG: hypothetical protein ABI867_07570 [Kofleriaceae bacterium]
MNHATRAIVAGAALLASSPAVAAPTDIEVFEHPNLRGSSAGLAPHDVDGKPYMKRQVGAGFEHANVAVCGSSILIAGVGSYERDAVGVTPDMHAYGRDINTNDLLQTMVVAGQMTTEGLEVGGAYYVMPELSGGNRNRDGMKPGVTCLDPSNGLFIVASNFAPTDLAQTYAAVFQVGRNDKNDIVASQLGPATMVLASDADNCSDRDYQDLIVRKTPGGYRVNLTGSCNGNGSDVAYVTYFDVACVGTCNIAAGPKTQVSQGQIERYRAQTYQLGADTFMAIGTEGDTQPPQNGISATIFSGDTLALLSSSTIAGTTTNELGTFYSTMSHGAQLGPDTFLITYQQRNGRQRREGKGGTTFMMGVLQADAVAGARWLAEPKPGMIQGFSATHHGSCTTHTGEVSAPKPAAFLISASPNGGTPAVGTFVSYTAGAIEVGAPINLNTNIDSGLLSNYYGENPGNQGKNSLYCASIENPGYGIKGAYRPEVKEFVVVPATSRVPDAAGLMAEKLGLDIVLVPAVIDPTIDDSAGDDGAAAGCGCSTPGEANFAGFAIALGCAAWLRRRRGARR